MPSYLVVLLVALSSAYAMEVPTPIASVYCAWLAWSSCDGCQQQSTMRTRLCQCEAIDFAPPPESQECELNQLQSETCSDTFNNGGCFYTWPSTTIVILGLGLLLLTTVLLACARIRQYYGRICFCRSAGIRGNGGVSSSGRLAGASAADVRASAATAAAGFDFPPPFHVAVRDWPPAYSECPPLQQLQQQQQPPQPGSSSSAADDFPPPYEESAARFKQEIRHATQRWTPSGFVSQSAECAPEYTSSQSALNEERTLANQPDSAQFNPASQSESDSNISGQILPSQSAESVENSQSGRSDSPIGVANAAFAEKE